MRKIFLLMFLFFTASFNSFATVEDNQVIDQLNKKDVKELNFDFNLKTFKSCDDLESVMGKYIKDYYKTHKNIPYSVLYDKIGGAINDIAMPTSSIAEVKKDSGEVAGSNDFGKTNTQVSGVDESDLVKTDGKYIYYFNYKDHYVYILKGITLEIVKKIKLPDNFSDATMFLGNNRLIILSNGYSKVDYSRYNYWINRNSKTYSIIYDTTDITNPKLLKLQILDGNLIQSRKIGKYLYIISSNGFNIPYYNFKNEDDIVINYDNIIPKKIELNRANSITSKNLVSGGKTLPYVTTSGDIAKCSDIEYILPDEETLKKYEFNPSYNIISIIDTENTSNESKTKVIAGSNSEIYMSLDNLYLTSNLYQSYNFSCPRGAYCIMPYYSMGENTLIHKLSIKGNTLNYTKSNIIPGNPLNQYSMDEKDNYFRIITQKYSPERQTSLYILDKDLKLAGKLEGLGKTEDFKSSRFIGDKLFLVTFKQIDPLFAIDLADQKNPKIIGELKIPGYSTYLHPYDESHLIGIGYNTKENKYGGTINDGIKIDLYELNYNKKCGDSNLTAEEKKLCDNGDYKGVIVKQLHTLILGQNGSTSEALNNPRMFMWNANKKLLLIPATLYKNNGKDYYNYTDFYNGLFGINIDKNSGIKQSFKVSHIDTTGIEEKRKKECLNYAGISNKEPICHKIIGGGEYCEASSNNYVPEYCYENSAIGQYLVTHSYDYVNSFIKRGLWIDNNVYSISDDKIGINNLTTGKFEKEVKMK